MERQAVKELQGQARGILIGYGVQFLAGMTINLFVKLPDSHPGTASQEYFSGVLRGLGWALTGGGGWALAVHAYIALGLTIGSLALCVQSIRLRKKTWIIASSTAALFTIGALFNGLSFINYNHDFSSMIMASCWLIAVGSIVFALTRVEK